MRTRLTQRRSTCLAMSFLLNAYTSSGDIREILDVPGTEHVDHAEVVDEYLEELDCKLESTRVVDYAVEETVGNALGNGVRRHRVVFRVIDDAEKCSKQQRCELLSGKRKFRNDAVIFKSQLLNATIYIRLFT